MRARLINASARQLNRSFEASSQGGSNGVAPIIHWNLRLGRAIVVGDNLRNHLQGMGFRMDRRRGEVEILRDILSIALKGVVKTRIVYGANLNFIRLKRYLDRLESWGLIRRVDNASGQVIYKTTEKGRIFLNLTSSR